MGTRGLFGFLCDNRLKMMYNHFDSYPSHLGVEAIRAIQRINLQLAKTRINNIRLITHDYELNQDDINKHKKFANTNVSTHDLTEPYCLLRKLQGNFLAYLNGEADLMIDSLDFARDSLFCEWAWIINLDDKILEVYRGFQHNKHNCGRFAMFAPLCLDRRPNQYYPIKLIRTITFKHIRSNRFNVDKWIESFEERY